MKILVTGGAGFLGSHLCEELLKKGFEVICIDNLVTGSLKNIEHLKINPHFKFINRDISQELPKIDVYQIYHLASPASPNIDYPKSYQNLPFETMQVNTIATWNLAEFAQAKKAKFLFASTSEVYGNPEVHPQPETYLGNVSAIGSRAVYDESKRFGETITSAFVREKGLDGRIVRIFNTYGPKMALDDGRAMVEFAKAALLNKSIPVFGKGTQTRSFMYVSDLVDGLIKAMSVENSKGEVFNIGNPEELTMIELAEKIKKLTFSFSAIEFKEKVEDDPQRRKPDISKAKTILDWEPKVSLDEGLPLFIDYVTKRLQKP